MFGWHMGEWGPGMGWGGWLGFGHLLWWGLLAAGIVLLWRWRSQRRGSGPSGEDGALQLLRERYARGEIDLKEFEERRSHLERRA